VGFTEILLILFIVVLIFGTSPLRAADPRNPYVVAAELRSSLIFHGSVTAGLFLLGYLTGKEWAAAGEVTVQGSSLAFLVVFSASIGLSAFGALQYRRKVQPPPALKLALVPMFFLVAGLLTALFASRLFGPIVDP
jgi:hypothetical protein